MWAAYIGDGAFATISDMDITGRELKILANKATTGVTSFELNLWGNPKGIYFLRLQKSTEIVNIKLIKE